MRDNDARGCTLYKRYLVLRLRVRRKTRIALIAKSKIDPGCCRSIASH
jgi:hypothetical protein